MVDLFHQFDQEKKEQNSQTVCRLYKLHEALSMLLATEVLNFILLEGCGH